MGRVGSNCPVTCGKCPAMPGAPTPAPTPVGTACCWEACEKTVGDCAPGLFCCPYHKKCMDRSTGSTAGPSCDKCRAGGNKKKTALKRTTTTTTTTTTPRRSSSRTGGRSASGGPTGTFEEADKDGSGSIDRDEFQGMLDNPKARGGEAGDAGG